MKFALQVYTVRDAAARDMAGTLDGIAAMGYDGIELAGFNGLSVDELKAVLERGGLTMAGAHVGLEELRDNTAFWLDALPKLGCARVTVPGMPLEWLDEPAFPRTADALNAVGSRLAAAGVELSFHNHHLEFENGRFDRLITGCPDLKFELDTYWAEYAGQPVVDLMRRLGDRLTLIHLKDMFERVEDKDCNPNLFDGCLDLDAILRQARAQKLEWVVVEMDGTPGDPMEAAAASRKALTQRGY